MNTKIYKLLAGCLACCGIASILTACSKDDDRIPNVTAANCPDGIALTVPAEMQKLIYTDNTGADVLPLIVGESAQLSYTLTPTDATFRDVVWTTSDGSHHYRR